MQVNYSTWRIILRRRRTHPYFQVGTQAIIFIGMLLSKNRARQQHIDSLR